MSNIINNFGIQLSGLTNYEFSFSYRFVEVEKKSFESKLVFLKRTHNNSILPKDNLPCGFQDDVKIVNG